MWLLGTNWEMTRQIHLKMYCVDNQRDLLRFQCAWVFLQSPELRTQYGLILGSATPNPNETQSLMMSIIYLISYVHFMNGFKSILSEFVTQQPMMCPM